RSFPKDLGICKGISTQTVCPVHASCNLSAGVEAGNRCLSIGVYPEATHDMVGCGCNLHRLITYIHTEFEELLQHHREPALDLGSGKVGYVQVHTPMRG